MSRLATKLKEQAKKFPDSPGVYFFRDKERKPVYIGRATSLKRRVTSYFLANRDPRIAEMVSEASSISFQRTDTLLEAIILEANLIKKYWPKYNVSNKDNKSFIYMVITDGDYPKPIIIRGRELEKYMHHRDVDIFGPYQSYYILQTVLKLIRKIFPYCTHAQNAQSRPCFHYQIGQCPGACIGAITPQEYKKNIKNLVLFFRGEKRRLAAKLKKEHPDKLQALRHINDVALISESNLNSKFQILNSARIEGYDISHLAGKEPVGAMVVFEAGERDPAQYRLFNIKGDNTQNDIAMLTEVLTRRLKHAEWPHPDIVFVDGGLGQARAVRKVLEEHRLHIPVVGLAKSGGHAGSAYTQDKLAILGAKKSAREMILASKKLFQQVRTETHRFVIAAGRRRTRKTLRRI